jgi:hypothetical protein
MLGWIIWGAIVIWLVLCLWFTWPLYGIAYREIRDRWRK